MTQNDDDDNESLPVQGSGELLKRGEKFSSTNAFLRFVGLPGKQGRKAAKRSRGEADQSDGEKSVPEKIAKENSPELQNHAEPEEKDTKGKSINISKLRAVLSNDEDKSPSTADPNSLAVKANMKLSASRFRFINEQLYSQRSKESLKLFSADPSLFPVYHRGFRLQTKQWPLDPLDRVIADCRKLDKQTTIADFGCGEARLAESLPDHQVHSFDLVAANQRVTACDMAATPLQDATIDLAVFCLALMGTNIKDFIFEAARVLKVGGKLKIGELESRFQGEENSVENFVKKLEKYGLDLSDKDLEQNYFYFLEFKKTRNVLKKKKLPEIFLKACVYKKR